MTKIAILVGSLRDASFNKALARTIEQVAPEGTEFIYGDIAVLPLFNEDLEAQYPQEAANLKEIVRSADGLLIVTAEYNRGIPGVLKNAIDWISRPWEGQPLKGKPVAIAGVSSGKIGTAVAQSHLRQMLVYLEARLMGQPEFYGGPSGTIFDESGRLDEKTRQHLERFITSFVDHIAA